MRRTKDLSRKDIETMRKIIEQNSGYYIKNKALLIQAFTRCSFSSENGGEDNEVLEFIGDQIMGYYIAKIAAERCGVINEDNEYDFTVDEGKFTALKQELVNNEALAKMVDEWGIIDYLIVGRGDFVNEIDKRTKVRGDLFEAILGAIAVDSKWDPKVLEQAVTKMCSLEDEMDDLAKNCNR